jgi:cytoskeletal protein CcmA (bactofilin family)
MFKKWTSETNNDNNGASRSTAESNAGEPVSEVKDNPPTSQVRAQSVNTDKQVNTILKGSKLIGDINVTSDLVLSGDVEGNIKSGQNSNIILKGSCKGNVETKGGSINIDGSLEGGNITAGKDVTISGKFKGGDVNAGEKLYIDGEFYGKLEANDIEIGAHAQGQGELHYRQYISIARGAKVEVQISQVQGGVKAVKDDPKKKIVDIRPAVNEADEAKG